MSEESTPVVVDDKNEVNYRLTSPKNKKGVVIKSGDSHEILGKAMSFNPQSRTTQTEREAIIASLVETNGIFSKALVNTAPEEIFISVEPSAKSSASFKSSLATVLTFFKEIVPNVEILNYRGGRKAKESAPLAPVDGL